MAEILAHSKHSASKMKQIAECPACVTLAAAAPPLPEHQAATVGTDTHACLEAYNTRGANSFAAITKQLRREGKPEDMIERAQKAHLRIMAIKEQYPGADFMAETKVDTSFFLDKGDFGTVDAAIAEMFGVLTIIDYKNGVMPVSPIENYQGICYALGIAKTYDYNFERVDIVILQPNSRVKMRQESLWSIAMKDLLPYVPFFQNVIKETKKKNPTVKSGDWCYFCPAKDFNCPAHREKRADNSRNAFMQAGEEMW